MSVGELFRYVRRKVDLDTQFHRFPGMLIGDNEDPVDGCAFPLVL